MKRFYSLSQYPGSFGKYFYNSFFEYYKIDALYQPLGSDSVDLILEDLFAAKVDGISISMPFKKKVISHLENVSDCVKDYDSCNTIAYQNNNYTGYNADLSGCEYFTSYFEEKTSILGNGSIGNMLSKLAGKNNLNHIVYSRSLDNWNLRHEKCDLLVNCTALGTSSNISPVEYIPDNCKMVLDVCLKENNLKDLCLDKGIKYISGLEFYKKQFSKQFEIYNNIIPDLDFFDYLAKKLLAKEAV